MLFYRKSGLENRFSKKGPPSYQNIYLSQVNIF